MHMHKHTQAHAHTRTHTHTNTITCPNTSTRIREHMSTRRRTNKHSRGPSHATKRARWPGASHCPHAQHARPHLRAPHCFRDKRAVGRLGPLAGGPGWVAVAPDPRRGDYREPSPPAPPAHTRAGQLSAPASQGIGGRGQGATHHPTSTLRHRRPIRVETYQRTVQRTGCAAARVFQLRAPGEASPSLQQRAARVFVPAGAASLASQPP